MNILRPNTKNSGNIDKAIALLNYEVHTIQVHTLGSGGL